MKNNRKSIIIVLALASIGIILILFGNLYNKSNTETTQFDNDLYIKGIEEKLENFLLSVENIKEVKVIITLEPIANIENSIFNETEKTDGTPLPTVRGVAIACTNGSNQQVKMKITNLVAAYLGISSHRIEIIDIK